MVLQQKTVSPYGNVGLSNLANSLYREACLEGLDLNVLVVGESGLGKSTLINNLFGANLYLHNQPQPLSEPGAEGASSTHLGGQEKETLEIQSTYVRLNEKGIQLRLNLIDTPGFGDLANNSVCFDEIEHYITTKLSAYFSWEYSVKQTSEKTKDPRVHLCLYFLPPIGRGLREIDLAFMKRLHMLTNIVPVISKCDALSPELQVSFKRAILQEIQQHDIRILRLEGNEFQGLPANTLPCQIMGAVPFAVMGSRVRLANGRYGRQYPWGAVYIDDPKYSDFSLLRKLIVEHAYEVALKTHTRIYERFRQVLLFQKDWPLKQSPAAQLLPRAQNRAAHRSIFDSQATFNPAALSQASEQLDVATARPKLDFLERLASDIKLLALLKQEATKEFQNIEAQASSLKAMQASLLSSSASASQPSR